MDQTDDLSELQRDPKAVAVLGSQGSEEGDLPPLEAGNARDRGMLDWPDKKLAKYLVKIWKGMDRQMQGRLARWQMNKRRRRGERYVGMIKDPDRQEWRVYAPPDVAKVPASLGRAPRYCRRLTAQMFQDPPLPEATPTRDDDEARDSAELSTQILVSLSGEAGPNSTRSGRRAFDRIHDHGSGFRHHWVDPQGGGSTPVTIIASAAATTEQDALETEVQTVGADGQPATVKIPQPEPYLERYVRQDGSLTDDQSDADITWLPKLCHDVLTGVQVRMWPVTVTDIDEARIAMVLLFRTWGDITRTWPDVAKLPDEDQKRIVSWRPERLKDLLPRHITEEDLDGTERKDGKPADDAICVLLMAYAKSGPEAPDGLYAVVGGGRLLLAKEDWRYVNDDTGKVEALDIPIDQFKGWEEGDEDPYGYGYMDFLGSGDELLASIDASRITHFQRIGARRTFLPTTSNLTTKQLQSSTGTVLAISPGGEPKYEDIPAFPSDIVQFRQQIADEMVDESGLQPSAQGQDSPNVQSGFHAVTLIEQTLAGLSDIRENAADALERGWRIDLQLVRTFFTGAHVLELTGPDGIVKVKHWTASDLSDTRDVRILRGTFSMLSPSMKSSIALAMSQSGLLSKEGLQRATEGNTGGLLALQDDPHILRVRRQVEAWREGPPAGPGGQPDPMAPSPFDYRPVDDQPDVAPLRATELGRAMASTKYDRKPPAWQGLLQNEYLRAAAAARGTPMPPPQQPGTAPAMAPGMTPGASPQTPPLTGAPLPAGGAAAVGQVPAGSAPSPISESGDPRMQGSPALPTNPSTLPQ